MSLQWIYLIGAGIFEIGFTVCMKNMGNHEHFKWSVGFYACIITSFGLLQEALKTIPIGTAYAVWTGIGAVGTAIVGMVWYSEPVQAWRIFFLSTLVLSIVGLKLTSGH
jgi:quaternary ammonium compound-resistance protein SugE